MLPYEAFYNLLETYVFGPITSGSYQDLVAMLFSTAACMFLVALPFMIVFCVLRLIFGWRS